MGFVKMAPKAGIEHYGIKCRVEQWPLGQAPTAKFAISAFFRFYYFRRTIFVARCQIYNDCRVPREENDRRPVVKNTNFG